jgi:transcriptional regulator with XRE-family HTH domain
MSALAKRVNVGPDYLSKLFRGIGTPSVPMAEKLAAELNIPIEQLLRELEEERARRITQIPATRIGIHPQDITCQLKLLK